MSGFNALSIYKIQNPQSVTATALNKFSFANSPSGDAKVWGWTNIDDLMDTTWTRSVPEKGEFMTFALRIDTRKVPAPLIKARLAEALQEEAEKKRLEGKEFVSRARKKELKELITAKLLSKTEPVPAAIDVAIDMTTGVVYVGNTGKSMLDIFCEYFARSFGEQPEPLISTLLAPEKEPVEAVLPVMQKVYDNMQHIVLEDKKYTVCLSDNEIVHLAVPGDVSSKVSGAGGMSALSVTSALDSGMVITKLQIQVDEEGMPENACLATWNSDFSFSGLRLPVLASEHEDMDGLILEKLYLLGQFVGVMGKMVAI